MIDNDAPADRKPGRDRLETERLELRWLTVEDASPMLSIWNDPAFLRYVGDRGIRTVDKARQVLADGLLRQYESHGYGPFRLTLTTTRQFVGICGLFHRETLPDPDIGFALLPEFCGRGLAWEAASRVADQARNDIGLPRLTAIVSPGNVPSVRLIEKLGLQFERMLRMPGDSDEVCLYACDWRTAAA